ncbi:hypothetical protein [Alteromonas sp. 14N.309.X.WAT.G.H12]|uniref:hypothetical protein n=1 Tax=Alteromonas sp. 14N.309.X.WAT.G.H12 TaxID=3120824 RepID=UPI002FD1F1D2
MHERACAYLQAGRRASAVIRFIDEQHRQFGADNGSYFCAVQFGVGTSHPHGVPCGHMDHAARAWAFGHTSIGLQLLNVKYVLTFN